MTNDRKVLLGLALVVALALGWSWRRTASNGLGAVGRAHNGPASVVKRTFVRNDLAPSEHSRAQSGLGQEPQRPHPITPAHEALARRREVIAAIVGALDDQHYEEARQRLAEADALAAAEPEDSTLVETVRGYRLILNCLAARAGSQDLPGELRQASSKYVDEQRLPPRRQVRRVCLEGRPFGRRV